MQLERKNSLTVTFEANDLKMMERLFYAWLNKHPEPYEWDVSDNLYEERAWIKELLEAID